MTSKFISWVLLLTCLLLGTWLVMPYSQSELQETSDLTTATAIKEGSQDDSTSQYQPKELDNYSALSDIPLFSPDRKPVEKEEEKPVETAVVEKTVEPKQPVVETFENPPRLVGVMMVEETEMAFVLGEQDSEVVSLALGEEYKDWILSKIDSTEITMTRNESDTVIAMDWLGREILQAEMEFEERTASAQQQAKAPVVRRSSNTPTRPSFELEERLEMQLDQTF